VEAKCYKRSSPIKIDIVRNSVGVLKDINENYFSTKLHNPSSEIKLQRFNYHYAIFSTSGFTDGAQAYAIAHQIFLIQYSKNGILEKIIDELLNINDRYISASSTLKNIRKDFRMSLIKGHLDENNSFTKYGKTHIDLNIIENMTSIRGSYFGMLQGMWPMHLLDRNPLPSNLFMDTDKINCRVYGFDSNIWSFSPIEINEGEPGWFRLEFELPPAIAEIVSKVRHDPVKVANIKQQNFSYIDLAGKINGIQRQIRLEMDQPWIENYIAKMRRRKNK